MIKTVLIIIYIATIATIGGATEHKIRKCVKYVAAVKSENIDHSINDENTRVALTYLNRFRGNFLSKYEYHPSNSLAQANSRSKSSLKDKVTQRVSALLLEDRAPILIDENSEEGVQQILSASVYFGAEEIENHLVGRREFSNSIKSNLKSQFRHQDLRIYLWGPISIAAYSGLIVNWAATPLLSSMLLTWFTALNRDVPEIVARSFAQVQFGKRTENMMLSELAKMSQKHWVYNSFDMPLPQNVASSIWETGQLSSEDLSNYISDAIYPKSTSRVTGERFTITQFSPAKKHSWIRIDELLTYDKLTQTPVLIIVARLTENIPKYPKYIKKRAESTLGKLIPVPLSIPK